MLTPSVPPVVTGTSVIFVCPLDQNLALADVVGLAHDAFLFYLLD